MTDRGHVLGVVGASGGLGASVLSCALAIRAAVAGWAVVAVDGVRLGGGLDVTMGIEAEEGLRWPDLAGVRGRVDGVALAGRLPVGPGAAPVLSFDRNRDVTMQGEPVREVLSALCGVQDLVVVDLPRAGSEAWERFIAPCDQVLLLAGSTMRALAAATALARVLDQGRAAPWLCLRSRRLQHEFGDSVAEALDLPLIGILPDEPRLDTDLEHGCAPGSTGHKALVRLADQVLAQVVMGAGHAVA